MSDKNITELEWKKFAKGKGYKDGAFVKALAALETGKTPEAKLAALDTIEKEGDALRKANKADKELGSYLDDAEKAAGKERKLQEMEAKKAAAKQSASEEDEDDSPAALTSKMIPLLRQVRKGDVMHTMVAITGKEVAVMVSRKPIGPPKRKLLTDYLGASGGVKFVVGECIWEENAHTFVLSTQAGGLAKKIKAALLKQVEQRFKVRVRGEDPNDIDDDGEPAPEQEAQAQQSEQQAPEASSEPANEPSPEQVAFDARWAQMAPRLEAALAGQHAEASKLRAVSAFATEKAEAGNHKSALAALDQLEKFLSLPVPTTPPASAGKVDYAKCRLAWDGAKRKAQAEYQKLEAAIVEAYKDDPGFADIAVKIRKMDTVLADFAENLSDTLDRALNETDAAARQRYHQEAAAVIRKFLDRSANDPFIQQLEANPFVPITAQATLVGTLGTLAKLIG
ncbi:hypothetical protein SNE35_15900 [Paucibacter sp. R3-3]|uniref:Uncharacterized protein n=1 Tax=Roseateles agri TaxID=3098619 RepID=A0ABU5DI81_9BURK|nr:hypothetical protein [Paucibacter sp. R3-3]MDY0746005.1 hypothetical protein [Paucibacter sp. R3-3]